LTRDWKKKGKELCRENPLKYVYTKKTGILGKKEDTDNLFENAKKRGGLTRSPPKKKMADLTKKSGSLPLWEREARGEKTQSP